MRYHFKFLKIFQQEPWESPEAIPPPGMGQPQWGRPMRRGASTLELGGGTSACAGCAQCAPPTWRYGSCATLDQPWGVGQVGWPMQQCCPPQQPPHGHFHMHQHMPQTPQPYRRGTYLYIYESAAGVNVGIRVMCR